MAFSLQLLSGLLFNVVIFMLVVQSQTVISMLLNFAALAFLTEIDDVAFSLADRGYFSPSIAASCRIVHDFQIHATKKMLFRRLFGGFTVLALLTGFAVVTRHQYTGRWLCDRVQVQLGDAYFSELAFFSGVYRVTNKRFDGRFAYIDESSGKAAFRYCYSVDGGSWVFGYSADNQALDI